MQDLSTARRNVWVLAGAQALLGSQMPIHFVFGGLAGQNLAGNPCFATLPITMTVVGSMVTAPILSEIMQRHGRVTGFVLGAAGGGIGAALCMLGLLWQSFAIFLVGSFLIGVYMSAQGFYRFAATDTAPEDYKPKAISWVLGGGLLSAVIGPQLAVATKDAIPPVLFVGSYAAALGVNLVGVALFAFLRIPRPPRRTAGGGGRTRWELMTSPRIAVAMCCAMVSYALMNLVMTSTPLAVVGCGYSDADAGHIVTGHVLAMFAPSFITGHLIARFGVERIITAGLVLLAAAGGVALAGVELTNFYVALILLGLGWNFGFIGGTAMLASAHTAEERGRVQGMNDFAVFGLVAIASLASGALMNCSGGTAMEGWRAVNLAMIPFLTVAALALALYAGRRPLPAE